MNRNKLLSVVLSTALVFGTAFVCDGFPIEINADSAESHTAVDTSEREIFTPYNADLYQVNSNVCDRSITDVDEISIDKIGVPSASGELSYGLKISGKGKEDYCGIGFGTGSTKFLSPVTNYKITLKVKKLGTVESFSFGYSAGFWDRENTFEKDVNITDITDEWTEQELSVRFKTGATDYWDGIVLKWKLQEGSELYIDDIDIIKTQDNSRLWDKGSFDTSYFTAEVDNTADTDLYYYQRSISEYNASWNGPSPSQQSNVSIVKEGIGGSYAMKITSNGGIKQEIRSILAYQGNSYYKAGHTYRIGFKAKKQGDMPNFPLMIMTTAGSWPSFKIGEFELTDDWKYYGVNYTFTGLFDTTGHKHIGTDCIIPDGAEVLIDDIEVYDITDVTKTNNYSKGSFEYSYYKADVDNNPVPNAKYSPMNISDYRAVNLGENEHLSQSNVSIVKNEGVRGSCALKIDSNGSQAQRLLTKLAMEGDRYFTTGHTYRIGLKAKKVGDAALSLPLALEATTGSWAVVKLSEFELSDEWQYYGINLTFNGNNFSEKGHKNIGFDGCSVPDGSYILVDDLEVYDISDTEKKNYYTAGSFDYSYYTEEFDNTPVEGVSYINKSLEDYNPVVNYDLNSKNALKNNDNAAIVSSSGVKGSSALKLDGKGNNNKLKSYIQIGNGALSNNSDYDFTVKLRRDGTGKLNYFKLGFATSWTDYTVGTVSDDMLENEFVCYRFRYRTLDNCAGQWNHIIIEFAAEEGMSIFIDEIIVKPVSVENSWLLAADGSAFSTKQFDFDYVDKTSGQGSNKPNFSDVHGENEISVTPFSYNSNSIASVASVSDAITGSYVMKLGFDPEKESSGECQIYFGASNPGKRYKVSFWIKVCGNAHASVGISNSLWAPNLLITDFNQYEYGSWTKVEFIYNDLADKYTCKTYRKFLVTVSADKNCGVLIDNIVIHCEGSKIANLQTNGAGDFETYTSFPAVVWDDERFIYKKGGK